MRRVFSTQAIQTAIEKSLPDFEKVAGSSAVRTQESVRRQFARDESHFISPPPAVVLEPTNVEQVSKFMKICNDRGIPVVPFGTGTGLEGGSMSTLGGVCISTQQIIGEPQLREQDFVCSVKPSTTRIALNDAIKHSGLFFPVDPGADASVCGMVATSASGTNAIRYGTMKENVINLEVVLADGTILDTKGKGRCPRFAPFQLRFTKTCRKSSAGFNFTELFVGSEGTLGVITQATVKVHPRPQFFSAAVCAFSSVHQAASTVVEILQWSIPVARIELLDTVQVQASNAYSNLSLREAPTLFIEFHGSSEKEVADQTAAVEDICKSHEALDFDSGASPDKMANLWKARHNAYYAALALRKGARGFTTDVCVPISKLADVISETRADLDEHEILGTVVGHVGDGNFHVILPTIEEDKTEHRKIQSFSDRLVRRALAADGTCTGEHGIGLGKRKYLREELGENTIRLMHTVKKALDPKNILNPGKVLPEL
uniref:D-lactate dehydrogenase (cytochrome) n=1 Tax=Caenorhabditis tropicalis TaxID=1561998 RepID=A0A1I7TS70_9PELO